jgi:hypothetical protein
MTTTSMATRSTTSRAAFGLLAAALAASLLGGSCECGAPPLDPSELIGDGFAAVDAVDAQTVRVRFADPVEADSVADAFSLTDFTSVPPLGFEVLPRRTAEREVTLSVARNLVAGVSYTIVVDGVRTTTGRTLSGTLNFTAVGGVGDTTTVRVVVEDVETARRHTTGLQLLVTLADDGAFSESLQSRPIADEGDVFAATLTVGVDPGRTVDPSDDADVAVDRRPYGLMLVDGAGRMASNLVTFVAPTTESVEVRVSVLPPIEIIDEPVVDVLPPPPVDDNVGDGLKQVRLVVDDRAARELVLPQLKVSFGADGTFDESFPRTLTLTPMTGDDAGYWETTVAVRVDPARVLDGTTAQTFPYFAFLVEDGTAYEALAVSVVAPDEAPQTVRVSLGNPTYTPVTFRVDASRAYLNTSGSERGVRAGEAVFLTGEWQIAVDALGNNCGDAFSGGEQPCLKMREIPGKPGVWQRTIWLPPGRPYGWKAVRCDAAEGCGPLNRLVSSAGRAFATVMKNLATDNVDAFADGQVGIIDAVNPTTTQAAGRTIDYTGATVFQGARVGSEPDPSGTPDGLRMFKQEVPDLVVVVAAQPIVTRVVHVGTWRDVNLGVTPQQIISGSLSVELTPVDYDDGFIGRFPPSREEP